MRNFLCSLLLLLIPATATDEHRHLLTNGKDTVKGRFPYHVRVGCCSGALIAPDMVLSAGHSMPPNAAGMTVHVGAYMVPDATLDGTPATIKQGWLHPEYGTIKNDFSILQLDTYEGMSDAPLLRINRDDTLPQAGQNLTLLGTGTFSLSGTERPEVLQEATTRVISESDCSQAFDPQRNIRYDAGMLDKTNFCTLSDQDGCVFDSGGPIIAKGGGDKDDLLVGLISFGVDCADPVYPAINSRVSAVRDWINEIVCQNSVDPPTDFQCNQQQPTQVTAASSLLVPTSRDQSRDSSSIFLPVVLGIALISMFLLLVRRLFPADADEECFGKGEQQTLLGGQPGAGNSRRYS